MSKVDWSLAPEDATHFGQDIRCYSTGGIQYYRLLDEQWFYWAEGLGVGWKSCDRPCRVVIKLSSAPDKAKWSGPEDGLPPVGTVCELRDLNRWHVVEIKYVSREHIVVQPENFNEWALKPMICKFRAIKTPQQLAADKRETAIRDVMDIAQVDCRVTAARLVDAGFKR